MAKQNGREMIVKMETAANVYTTLCGLISKTITINNTAIDVTTADCTTPGGALWTETLSGVKSVQISGNGFFEDSTVEATMNTLALAADPRDLFQLIVPSFGTYQGTFMLTSFEFGSELANGVTYSITLESSGAVAFTAA